MPTLNFTTFHGAVPRCHHYALSESQGFLYLVPEDTKTVRRYDPFEDVDRLLLDVVRIGAAVAACDPFLDYALDHHMLPLRDAEFWLYGDFFTKHSQEAQPMVDALVAFVERYGLPAWDVQSIITTFYPARYEQRLLTLRRDSDNDELGYLLEYETVKRACQSSGAVPVCTLALLFLDFYLQFLEGESDGQFPIRNAEWVLYHRHKKTPGLTAQVYDLATCIHLAYVFLVSGEGKAVRQCKNCGKFFVADDLRAEYCSPRCRGAYNSKMTRKRVKERKQREGQ